MELECLNKLLPSPGGKSGLLHSGVSGLRDVEKAELLVKWWKIDKVVFIRGCWFRLRMRSLDPGSHGENFNGTHLFLQGDPSLEIRMTMPIYDSRDVGCKIIFLEVGQAHPTLVFRSCQ